MIQEFLFQTLQKGKLWVEFVNFGLWWKVRRRFYWMNMSSVEFWKEYVFSIFLNCGLQERVHLNFLSPHPSVERLWSFWLDEEIWLELESFDVISVITSPVFSSGIVPSLIGQLFKSNQFYRSTTECIRDVKIEICYNRRTELNKLSTFTTNAQLNSEWIALGADYPFCRLLLLSKYITISPL